MWKPPPYVDKQYGNVRPQMPATPSLRLAAKGSGCSETGRLEGDPQSMTHITPPFFYCCSQHKPPTGKHLGLGEQKLRLTTETR
jgi:hypothetical protein